MSGSVLKRFGQAALGAMILWFVVVQPLAAAPSKSDPVPVEDFPIFPAIKANMEFWKSIFATYDRSQGVIHDSLYLGRVFEVIPLDPSQSARAARKNKKAKKAAAQKYKTVLLTLATGKAPATPLEKKAAAVMGPGAVPKDYKNAAHRLRCQTGLKSHFKAGLIRSGAVIDEFRRIFRSHGLPEDLIYLPCVESSFDFKAYSKFGAAGIWQFTRGTGRLFMDIGYVVDERRDPYISTDAAARLLKKNHSELNDWPMAITAYNHGLAGMRRAKKSKGTYEKIFLGYRSRSFKFASRNFYSEFLAAREVAKNYKTHFGEIALAKPARHTRFVAKGFLPAQPFVRGLKLDIQHFQELNPSLRSPVFKGQKYIPKGYEIRLPSHITREAAANSAAGLYHARQKPSRFHAVQKGDTAGSIARTHNVALKDLILANGLNKRAVIYIGQNLRIPAPDEPVEVATLPAAAPPAAAPVATASSAAETLASRAPEPASKKSPPKRIVQKVSKPKTVKQPVSSEVAESASVQPPATKPDQVPPEAEKTAPVPMPAPPMPAPPMPEAAKPAAGTAVASADTAEPGQLAAQAPPADNGINPLIDTSELKIRKTVQTKKGLVGVLRVEAEETLGHYADWLKIPTSRIRSLNRLPYGKAISINQEIKIPLPPDGAEPFEEKRFDFHREIEEDFFESYTVSGVDTYEVKNGDTLWTLCLNELEIPFWLLKKYNPRLDFNSLRPLQKLKYPVVNKQEPSRI